MTQDWPNLWYESHQVSDTRPLTYSISIIYKVVFIENIWNPPFWDPQSGLNAIRMFEIIRAALEYQSSKRKSSNHFFKNQHSKSYFSPEYNTNPWPHWRAWFNSWPPQTSQYTILVLLTLTGLIYLHCFLQNIAMYYLSFSYDEGT